MKAKLIPVGEETQRLNRVPNAQRLPEDADPNGALADYRRRHGVVFRTETVRSDECDECGKRFEGENARDRLNGHRQVHRTDDEDARDGVDETPEADGPGATADAADGDEARPEGRP